MTKENNINLLKNKIEELQKEKEEITKKDDKVRKIAIANTLIAASVHFAGALTHPLIVLAALIFLLIGVVPFAILSVFHYAAKEEKYEKEINSCTEKLKLLENEEEKSNEKTMESIPDLSSREKEELPILDNTPKNNTKSKKK